MAGDLVLITGATGHLGFRALRYALDAGYTVRAAVRSEAKAEAIRSNSALTPKEKASPLSFTIVPDILVPGAYDEAVKDVKYIIHIASPLPENVKDEFEKNLIQPAVQGTLNILEAAKKTPSVKRVVITSSVAAITPLSAYDPSTTYTGGPITASLRNPDFPGPYPSAMHAYAASKIAAFNRAESWIKEHKPSFDVIHIHPSYIEGRNDLARTTAEVMTGTNRLILSVALGHKSPAPNAATTNHVDDSAWLHVASLDPKIEGNQSFLVTSSGQDGTKWNDIRAIVKKHFPEAVEKAILSTEGDCGTIEFPYDAKKTEETFGIKFKGFEEQVVSVVGHYLEAYGRENGGE